MFFRVSQTAATFAPCWFLCGINPSREPSSRTQSRPEIEYEYRFAEYEYEYEDNNGDSRGCSQARKGCTDSQH